VQCTLQVSTFRLVKIVRSFAVAVAALNHGSSAHVFVSVG
jgi:hypothetical protein